MPSRFHFAMPLAFILLPACSSDDRNAGVEDGGASAEAGASLSTCDPFAPVAKSISLATIVGVGQSATGTIYVADQDGSTSRVFVSDANGALVRQRGGVTGTITDSTGATYTFGANGPDATFVLQIEVPASGPTRMAVLQGTLTDRKLLVIGQDGEELTVLPTSAIAGMPLRNLAGDVTLEYVAATPEGATMVVTRPTDDWTYADFRLFLGPSTAVTERKVSNVTRYHDGGTTIIVFDLDGASASAKFPILLSPSGSSHGQATLTVSDTTVPLDWQAATPPAGAAYLCSH